jgi:hypothetical protein
MKDYTGSLGCSDGWNIFAEVCAQTQAKYNAMTNWHYPKAVMAAAYKGYCESSSPHDPPATTDGVSNANEDGVNSWMMHGINCVAQGSGCSDSVVTGGGLSTGAEYCDECADGDTCLAEEQTKLLQPGAKQPRPDDLLSLMEEIDRSQVKEKAAAAAAGSKPGEDLGSLLETMSQHKAKSRAGRWSCW